MKPEQYLSEEPPTGSVVAIDWRQHRQEIWVSNQANVGNWYCPDIPMRGDQHPHWDDVVRRAQGRTMRLLVPGDPAAYAAGFDAGMAKVSEAIAETVDGLRAYSNGSHPETGPGTEDGTDA